MCTTYLPTELIRRTGLDVIGYPRLVRLNPNISYKTRGNGAVVLRLGMGKGRKFPVGRISGKQVFGYESLKGEASRQELLDISSEIIGEFAVMEQESTNPGLVVSGSRPPESLYREAVSKEISAQYVEDILMEAGANYRKFKNGRGVIGASSAMSWSPGRRTYELLVYQYPRPGSVDRDLQLEAAAFIEEHYQETFNNIDVKNRHAAIFPSNRTPVVYGVRSVNPVILPQIEQELRTRYGIGGTSYLIYETNQGTDDHIIHSPDIIWEKGSFSITGEVVDTPVPIQGGHYFAQMKWKKSRIGLAAFEPTKEFRSVFRELRPGDIVEATGSLSEGTLKVEKMHVISVSRYFKRVPPMCQNCARRMKTHGRNDFRCKSCGGKKITPEYAEEARSLLPGKYEVPVSARRHLSMPLKLEEHFALAEMSGRNGGPA